MSAGALAATLAVAFAGGGLGAIAAPWLQHRYGRSAHLAQSREQPYDRILTAGRDLQEIMRQRRRGYESDGEHSSAWVAAQDAFQDALAEADRILTPEMRNLASALTSTTAAAIIAYHYIPVDSDWDAPPPDIFVEYEEAAAKADAAYEAMRVQAARDTTP